MTRSFTRSFPRMALAAAAAGACSTNAASKPADTSAPAAAPYAPHNFTVTEAQRQRLHIITVQPVSFRPAVQATGNVAFNGDRSTQVLSPVSGPATKVLVSPGAVVKRGQPLATVSSPDFASAVADYRKAQASYRNAKRVAERDSALFKNDALARSELEQAQTDLASADADVEAAVQNMRALGVEDSQITAVREGRAAAIEAIIRSPIDGTVVEKLIADGQLLQAGTTACFTVADLSTMWVMTNVYANDLRDIAVGETADVITDVTQTPIAGRVDYVASLVDPGTKAVSVRVVAPNNNRVLRKDMFVRVEIKSRQEHRGLLVPASSVMRDDQNLPFVFVATTGGTFARRRVDLGTRVGDNYEVTAGLKPGEQVVAEGALFLEFAETQ
jgi:cobalt-zinc-cadmium efflux system membrane fusion protein